ncbi:MAG: pyridoxal phosphate-dependent aminotransferase [Candidatus Cloacimonadota bacterium]|nr:MAG: pyridoxal phosphate-dependent aminotransferase [Candidatus Cloacimonadota bacterium]
MKFSKRVEQLSDSVTLKINAKAKLLAAQGKDIINLSAGEPDFDTPEIIKSKAREAIDKGYTKYTPVSGIQPLKTAIVDRYKNKFGVSFSDDYVLVSSGAKQALYNTVETLCGPGDEVLIPVPYWVSYPEMVKISLAKPVFIDTTKTNYVLMPENIDKAINKNTKLLILNSPCNPTGVVYSATLLQEIASIVHQKGIFCIADEIYDELVYDSVSYESMITFIGSGSSNFIVANGVSKTYSMTGWRIGYAIASPEIIKKASKIQAHTTSCASSISQYAALSALTSGNSIIQEMQEAFNARRKLVIELFSDMDGITFPCPEGAFYLFFNISNFYGKKVNTSVAMAEFLLENYHVAVVPGAAFGDDKFLRLSYTLSLKKLKEGISRIRKGLLDVCR